MARIGFDAKRLFNNNTGLGNYSRSLVTQLKSYYPEHEYILFSPSIHAHSPYYDFTHNFASITPTSGNSLAWRSRGIIKDLQTQKIDIFHGLSHEIPFGIEKTSIRSIVSIHDVIYKFFPQDFSLIDKTIYNLKWKHACTNSDHIIAISQTTKQDIMQYFGTDESKISVVYQTCHERFSQTLPAEKILHIQKKHNINRPYILYVGALSTRKNITTLIEAYSTIAHTIDADLVIVGGGRKTIVKKIDALIHKHSLQQRVKLLQGVGDEDLPALYQGADCFVYPSFYEGFGIPILEAFNSGTAVIASRASSLPEVGGNAALYFNPHSAEELAQQIITILHDTELRTELIHKGLARALEFSAKAFAQNTIKIYNSL